MNKEIILENYLLNIKSTIEVYIHGTLESSNKYVRKILNTGLNETLEHQDRVYQQMVDNNMYKVENAPVSTLDKVYNKICKDN